MPLAEVDPVYFEKTYYLGPDKGGLKPYRLLSKAMQETGRAALAKYAARGKDYLVLLRPFDDGLAMQQLRYADEIRSFDEVPVGDAEVQPAELELALRLIEQVAADEFHPEQYEDEQRKRTLGADRAQDRGRGDRRPAGGGAEGADHRPDGRPEGQPRRERGEEARQALAAQAGGEEGEAAGRRRRAGQERRRAE